MPADKPGYVFDDTQFDAERARLQSIEAIFDPATRRRLLAAGLSKGARCLELGAGAGSIMRWMAEETGPSGHVTAVDINPRFLSDPPPNVRVVPGDIRQTALEPGAFDIIHARYVLVHIPEFRSALDILWKALKPGGRLVIEEPDFVCHRAAAGTDAGRRAFTKIHDGIVLMYRAKKSDPALGMNLPALLQSLGARELTVENDCPVSRGGSPIAEMMRKSSEALRDKYISTGKISSADMDNYDAFARDPNSWAVYYATVGATGRK